MIDLPEKLGPSVLVTGATGFIGAHLTRRLNAAGIRVLGLGRRPLIGPDSSRALVAYFQTDMTDVTLLRDIFDRHSPLVCIHLAGSASVSASMAAPLLDLDSQVRPLSHLLEAIRLSRKAVRTLLVSSAAVYGEPKALPVREDAPTLPISAYGYHKAHQELLVQQYRHLWDLRISVARIFSTFGEGLRGLAVWDIARRALAGTYTLHGTGAETRDYLYVADVVGALVEIAAQAPFDGEVINVASGTETPIRELAAMIYDHLGVPAIPVFNQTVDKGSPIRWRADISRLTALGFRPSLSLRQGLGRTIDWISADA